MGLLLINKGSSLFYLTMKQIQGIFFKDFLDGWIPQILTELYKDKVYEFYFKGKEDLTILDLGANVGLFTFYAYQYAKKIYSVEPSAEHFETLIALVNFNHMEKVTPINVAVAVKSGKQTFYHSENTTMYSLHGAVNTLPDDAEIVNAVTLDKLFKDNRIKHVDLMKVDIEGSECEVFASQGFKKVARKIDTIIGEYHDWSGVNPKQLENSIKDVGFKFRWLGTTDASMFHAERIK